jgi:hypothetical protein
MTHDLQTVFICPSDMNGVPCEHDKARGYTKIRLYKVSRLCAFNRVPAVQFFDRTTTSTSQPTASSVHMSMKLICPVISFPNYRSSQTASASQSRRRSGYVRMLTAIRLPERKPLMSTEYS